MRKFKVLLLFLFLSSNSVFPQTILDSVQISMKQFIQNDDNGLLFGFYDEITDSLTILTAGRINENNDLKLACPSTKSCISYIYLKEKIDLDLTIEKWFPKEYGYTKSDSITLKMLLYNTSGIQEYIKYIKIDPNLIITPLQTIQAAYQDKELEFQPGGKFQYSNTNYNILGIILEKILKKDFNTIIKEYFGNIAPSLRMDDGKGNYPLGYQNPWPFHWSATGFAGGLISPAKDAIKTFSYISRQPEYKLMTNWIEDQDKQNHLVGMGIYGLQNYRDLGTVVYYDGDMMANQMLLMKIDNKVYYFHTTYSAGLENLINFSYKVIKMIND
ncbi:MAG: serine hydrolase domain-containing protein [Calditrichaceae bacterium]